MSTRLRPTRLRATSLGRTRLRRSRRAVQQRGYAAILVALLFPVVFIAAAATAVDTARWYVEVQHEQNAADAASLAGVVYLPQDLTSARSAALEVAARNGYTDGVGNVSVTVERGGHASQLKVTIRNTIGNVFGAAIGVPSTTITRSATSDYTGPAPMGSPCNTFGNEPAPGVATSSMPNSVLSGSNPNCTSNPEFWATVEGPETDKGFGDRYSTMSCSSKTNIDGCTTFPKNDEYDPLGYFWVIKVSAAAVGKPVGVQLYDPEFAYTNSNCSLLPDANNLTSGLVNNMNPFVTTDGKARYGRAATTSSTGASYCSGDIYTSSLGHPMTTSFEVREQTDTGDPMDGASVAGCTKQYAGAVGSGSAGVPTAADLLSSSSSYDSQMAQVFHNWDQLCTFTPTREGDYYLHVRTNVSPGGAAAGNTNSNPAIMYSGNPNVAKATGNTTTGEGDNSFGIRLKMDAGYENSVSVSGFDRMPIFDNASGKTTTLNLIRVLPGAAGQYVSFSFFDAGDTANQDNNASGTITVLAPSDATGSIKTTPFPGGCQAVGGAAGAAGQSLPTCAAPVSHKLNNGRVETMSIPIPADYTCDTTSNSNCWYRVQVSLPNISASDNISDITTWDASIVGDPVRLIK